MEHVKALYHLIVALLAVLIYRYPASKLKVIAVTGTSGKTTTSHLIYWFLKSSGYKVSLISSVAAYIGNKEYDTGFHVTTPSPFDLQRFLRRSVESGDKIAVIEASSHGLAQFRMLGTNIAIGVLTNIAHEHLDFHKTIESYQEAKLSLLKKSKISLVNKDDVSYNLIYKNPSFPTHIVTFGIDNKSDFSPKNLPIKSSLPGKYNQYNVLAASSVSSMLGVKNYILKKALLTFPGVRGRFEKVKNNRGINIIVDFAHKPNALESFLITLKESVKNSRIIILFGSAGERDVEKRSMMGEIAGKYADISVLTAEDPRTDDVNNIIEEIAQGCLRGGAIEMSNVKCQMSNVNKRYFIKIPDRSEAINITINKIAQKGDIVAFLGKGHEKSMCYGKKEYPWDEYEEIHKALAK